MVGGSRMLLWTGLVDICGAVGWAGVRTAVFVGLGGGVYEIGKIYYIYYIRINFGFLWNL